MSAISRPTKLTNFCITGKSCGGICATDAIFLYFCTTVQKEPQTMTLSGNNVPKLTINTLRSCIIAAATADSPAVRNWGYLENWKSTASVG